MDKRIKEILYTQEEIETKIKELAQWVNETYKDSDNLTLVGIMKGSIPFLAQLIKDVTVDMKLDFMTISSYSGGIKSTGNFKVVTDLHHSVSGKDILIVEDIVDSGLTLKQTLKMIADRSPRSLKTMTLLDKPSGRMEPFEVDKAGFIIPDAFIVGFGLDYDGKLRNLPYIGIFDTDKLDEA